MLDELAGSVREGRVSPRELVDEALRRIEASDLGAVVALRGDEVRAEADASPRTGPLAGLPLLVKDLTRVAGMRTTLGSPLTGDAPIDEADDALVARLRAAGAIVVGKANTPAYGHTAVTTNPLFGPTRNPWNPARSPGGSSGGSAAALAAGLVPLATTTDGGGSVRIPASCCGLVGYKPTTGAIGRTGAPRWLDFSTSGCTGSSVADVLVEASVVVGGVAGDVLSFPAGTAATAPTPPSRLLACRSLRGGVDEAIGAAFDEASSALADELGAPLEVVGSVTGADAAMVWFTMACAELSQSLLHERDRWGELEPGLVLQLELGAMVSAADYIAARRRRYELCAAVDLALGSDAVLLTPTVNAPSWPADGPLPTRAGELEDPFAFTNTPDFNATGHPAVSVPLGRDADGVPFGLQVVSPRFRDDLALGVAETWERLASWPLVAPGCEPFGVADR